MNNQLRFPSALGRIEFSRRLCRLQYYAAWPIRTPIFSRKLNDLMIASAA